MFKIILPHVPPSTNFKITTDSATERRMWCANCQIDVACEASQDATRVHCANCGTDLTLPGRVKDRTRSAQEILARWSQDSQFDDFGPIGRPLLKPGIRQLSVPAIPRTNDDVDDDNLNASSESAAANPEASRPRVRPSPPSTADLQSVWSRLPKIDLATTNPLDRFTDAESLETRPGRLLSPDELQARAKTALHTPLDDSRDDDEPPLPHAALRALLSSMQRGSPTKTRDEAANASSTVIEPAVVADPTPVETSTADEVPQDAINRIAHRDSIPAADPPTEETPAVGAETSAFDVPDGIDDETDETDNPAAWDAEKPEPCVDPAVEYDVNRSTRKYDFVVNVPEDDTGPSAILPVRQPARDKDSATGAKTMAEQPHEIPRPKRKLRFEGPEAINDTTQTAGHRSRTTNPPRIRQFHDAETGRVPAPHFTLRSPEPQSNWSMVAGQWLAYVGVLGLTIGTAMVVSGYFGGYANYTPVGWLITTVGQMLLFLGVINLVSGGMEQSNVDVSQRIEVLGEHILRIEQVQSEQVLSGPKIPIANYSEDGPDAAQTSESRHKQSAADHRSSDTVDHA